MANRTEQSLIKPCIDLLTVYGCLCWRQNQGAMSGEYKGKRRFVRFTSQDGISDIIGLTKEGRFLAVELKVGRNKPTEAQAAFLADVKARGGIAIVAYSVDELDKKFKAITESD